VSHRFQRRQRHRFVIGAACAVAALTLWPGIRASAQVPEAIVWAYPHAPGGQNIEDDGTIYSVPGSELGLTWTQVRGRIVDESGTVTGFSVPDWHPGDHPPMPTSVAEGRGTDVRPCGYCHMPHGLGRPENAAVAGLPVDYFIQQVNDMRSGARRTLDPRRIPPTLMLAAANAVSDEAVRSAAEYFASLTFTPWTRVVEADTVPKTHVLGGMLVATEDGEMEPIGERIIEVPEDWERTELRDTRSGFVAYVPMGSLARGESLVTTGAGKTVQCEVCHGPGLTGLGNIPPIAGRSPSYMFRQLYEMQHGIRNGAQAALMKPVVANLSGADMIDIVAYVAALPPTPDGE
jgi:cytochrome c553